MDLHTNLEAKPKTPLQQAAQAVIDRWESPAWKDAGPTAERIYAMRDALARELAAQQGGEPVAYLYHDANTPADAHPWLHSTMLVMAADRRPGLRNETPLYAHLPARLQSPTDEQIEDAVRECDLDWHAGWTLDESLPNRYISFARAVLRLVGIGATEPGGAG